jgi:ribosomal protein S28E/S33
VIVAAKVGDQASTVLRGVLGPVRKDQDIFASALCY